MRAPWPGPLGPPPDAPSIAVAVAALLLLWQGRKLFEGLFRAPGRFAVFLVAGIATLLSAAYVDHYLRGGPRIIDATSYWLQARALSEGHVTWPIAEPTASFRGRFLLESGPLESPRIGVIFPPGYPAILALGFLLRAPMWIGPLTAGLLVVATYALAKRVVKRNDVAILAACLSALSAALRYHTADTMSHGWAALLLASSLALAYRAAEVGGSKQLARAALAGACFGWYFATRPVSALALLPVVALACVELPARATLVLALGAAVPAALFALEQRAVTGSFWESSQAAYYALADGPPGCFRYGFGTGIGCLHEHGAYVASVLPRGLTWSAAAITTLRRLRLHVMDVANAEPLVLLAALAPFLAARRGRLVGPDESDAGHDDRAVVRPRRILALAAGVVSIVLAYVPFYFDGSYPGGGGRLFADVLPLEHVLVASAVGLVLARKPGGRVSLDLSFASALVCATAMLGFAVHTSYEHASLREREGGRPFFEPAALVEAKVDRGLLFVGTDHAYNLAFDPRARDASRELVVAREFGDERDRLVWERLGRPATHRYVFEGRDPTKPAVVPWSAGAPPHPFRFEAEAEWPPLGQSGGWFEPVFAQGTCAWGGRLLAVRTNPQQPFQGTISFPIPFPGRFRVGVHVASKGEVVARFALQQTGIDPPLATWSFTPPRKDLMCATLAEEEVNLSGLGLLEVSARGAGELFVDAVALEAATPVGYAR
jgi:uncharacterized protein YqgC (DUF456 family)